MFENNVTEYTVYAVGVPIVVTLILIEGVFSASKKLGYYNRNDSLGTIGLILGNVFVNLVTKSSILAFYLFLYQFKIFNIGSYPLWVQISLTLITLSLIHI